MIEPGGEVARVLAASAGRPVSVTRRVPLGGGCIGQVERIETTEGPFVLKWMPNPPPDLFNAERAGLEAIGAATSLLRVPQVVAATPAFILLEWLEPGGRDDTADERLGRGLAELHRATNARYGFARTTWCGSTAQPNAWADAWVAFYASARLGYQLSPASSTGVMDTASRRAVERIIARLGSWISEPAEGPALIHGDLWSGNLHIARSGPALLDPAVYFGHREAELGMMTLFGGFGPRVFDAYDEAFPLDPGWRDRNPLYQLYHVLNHVNLFGAQYMDRLSSIVRRYA